MARVFGHPTRTLAAVWRPPRHGLYQSPRHPLLYKQSVLVVDHIKVFLRALRRDADTRHGLISVPNLMAYMSKLLPLLTQDNGERIASMEVRFQNALFVSEYGAHPRI